MNDDSKKTMEELFGDKLNDVEHAIGMYASSYCLMPAEGIYDKESLKQYKSIIDKCHMYIIGYMPEISLINIEQNDRILTATYSALGSEHEVRWDLPPDFQLHKEGELYYLQDDSGQKYGIKEEDVLLKLKYSTDIINFEVKYIGQSYGRDGSRNALDRLLKHETLQKISLKGVPRGYTLCLVLIEVEPQGQLFTVFNPWAENKDEDGTRIRAGLDKMYGTSEKEQIALYEAALIKYFYPDYNKEFKDSFPSTNLKILQDCYDKDFSTVIAEICIEGLPFRFFSGTQKPANFHIAKHCLHDDEARRIFFTGE